MKVNFGGEKYTRMHWQFANERTSVKESGDILCACLQMMDEIMEHADALMLHMH